NWRRSSICHSSRDMSGGRFWRESWRGRLVLRVADGGTSLVMIALPATRPVRWESVSEGFYGRDVAEGEEKVTVSLTGGRRRSGCAAQQVFGVGKYRCLHLTRRLCNFTIYPRFPVCYDRGVSPAR